jgi:MFS family permease
LLLRSVDRAELVSAFSYLTVPALLGPIAGPLLGGFITTYFHWRWILQASFGMKTLPDVAYI